MAVGKSVPWPGFPNPSPGYSGCLCLTSWPRDLLTQHAGHWEHQPWGKRGEDTRDPAVGKQAGCSCLLMSVPKVTLFVVSGRAIDFTVNYGS